MAAAALGIVCLCIEWEVGAGAAATFAKGATNPGSQAKFLESATPVITEETKENWSWDKNIQIPPWPVAQYLEHWPVDPGVCGFNSRSEAPALVAGCLPLMGAEMGGNQLMSLTSMFSTFSPLPPFHFL